MTPPAPFEEVLSFLRDDLLGVERELREGMRSVAPLLPQVGEHVFASGGKRIRPVLVLLAARLCGYRGPRAIQIATAAECLHTASLLHDDVVDGANVRRGQPSVPAAFGARVAILVGDFLYARTCQILVADGSPEVLATYAEAIRSLAEGELLQLVRSFDPELDERGYEAVIARKTSSLLQAASESGAILGQAPEAGRRALRGYGFELGQAFQLADDALDYVGESGELGKSPLRDLAEGKMTLPLIAALARCTAAEREEVHVALKTFAAQSAGGRLPDPDDLARVARCVARHAGVEHTLGHARERAGRARAHLAGFPDGEARRALEALAAFVVERRS